MFAIIFKLFVMFFVLIWYTLNILSVMECAVLDPALYLQPSPPIKLSNLESTWWQSPRSTVEIPPINADVSNINGETKTPKPRIFWPKMHTDYKLGSIHIPLAFSVSGLYGNYDTSKGTIGTHYASVLGVETSKLVTTNTHPSSIDSSFNHEPTVIRIYGSNNKPAWSGWGNGKWGHYGKG